ncbi:hypothetical protein H0H87_003464, partial [Tephrocybe sp. NHM501043]
LSARSADDIVKHTGREYAFQTAKEFFVVLEAVSVAVPVPGFAAAVKAALNIIKACEESHATIERAQDLKFRIKALVVILVNAVKGKTVKEIPPRILADIEKLSR